MTNGNAIRQVLFGSKQCQIFRWKDDSWYAVEEQNLLQIRQTFNNRACLTVQLEPSGELYLNAWILPDTFLQRISATDITISVTMAASQAENYLIHCDTESSATQLIQVLEKMHAVSQTININNGNNTLRGAPPVLSRSSSLPTNAPKMTAEELQKTLKLVMQCKCKLYVQNQSSNWHSFGSVHLKISNQWTTRKMHIDLSSHKGSKVTQLVSSMVQSRNVERLGPKRISFLLIDELQKTNVVYMIQVREELTGDKILEYIKEKNAENGW
jgi:biopolymer transport protein ExbD